MKLPSLEDNTNESTILLDHIEKLSKIGTWEINLQNNSLHCSDGVYRILGYEAGEIELDFEFGKNVVHPEDRERANKHAEAAILEGKEYNIQKRLLGKNKIIHVNSKASVIYKNETPIKLIGVFQDITETIEANTHLKIESELNSRLIEMMPSTFYLINQKGQLLKWNKHMETHSGYSAEEIAQMSPFDFFEGNEVEKIKKHIQIAFEKGYTEVEATLKTKSKAKKPYLYTAAQINYYGEQCVFGMGYDLSEFKNAQADLQRVLDYSMDIMCTIDKNGEFVRVSAASEKVLGYEPKEMIGKSFKDFICEEYIDEANQRLIDISNGEKANNYSNCYFHKNGKEVSLIWSVYWDEELQLIHCVAKDATEVVESQEKLKRSNERYEIVTKATNDAIWDFDVVNNQLFWAQGFETLFGYDLKKVKPTLDFLIDNIHPEDRPSIVSKIQSYMSPDNPETIWEEEYLFKKADGNYAYIIDMAIFIRNKKGEVLRTIGAMSDISHRKEYEESLRTLNAELEQNVKQLAISNAELEQFAFVASHDLQEPLRMVTGFMSLLKEKYKGKLDDKAQKYIHFATDGAQRMQQIILDLLDFSRVSNSTEELCKIDLNQLMNEIKLLHKKHVEEKKAQVNWENLPQITAFHSPVTRLFQNLINNAIKYSKDNVPPIVNVRAEDLGDEWKFSVSDNGIGIPEEFHEKIFIIFQRLHGRTQYTGNGIGLSIVKKIVDNLGGKIWLKSEKNVGSTFYFTIPKEVKPKQ